MTTWKTTPADVRRAQALAQAEPALTARKICERLNLPITPRQASRHLIGLLKPQIQPFAAPGTKRARVIELLRAGVLMKDVARLAGVSKPNARAIKMMAKRRGLL